MTQKLSDILKPDLHMDASTADDATVEAPAEPEIGYSSKTKKEKREQYGIEHIVPVSGEIQIKTKEMLIEETLLELEQARIAQRQCTGRVASIIEKKDDATKATMVCAQILYNKVVRVLIPMPMFLDERLIPNVGKADASGKLSRDRNIMSAHEGSEVDFLVREIYSDGINSIVLGDRVSMMKKIRHSNYISIRQDGKPRLYPGKLAEARVTFVADQSMGIEVQGFEKVMRNRDISFNFYRTLKDKYMPGDRIKVRVKDVILSGEGDDIDVQNAIFDGKDTGIDERDIAMASLPVGTTTYARVTNYTKDGKGIFVLDEDTDATILCSIPRFLCPLINDIVQVKVHNIDVEKKQISGRIQHIVGQK